MYAWKPNRDAGSVSSHRSPSTRRRYIRSSSVPENYTNVRAAAACALRRYVIDAAWTDDLSLSVRYRHGYDEGDRMTVSVAVY